MRALVFEDKLCFKPDYPQPTPESHQSLIRMRLAGICNTDLELTKGYMGFMGVLGHEFVGEVVAGNPLWIGKRVVGEINVPHGDCDMCRKGVPSQCRNRTTVGIDRHQGAFADYLALRTENLYAVPDTVSDEQAVFVEPLAAACNILELVHLSPRDRVVIVGAGKLGLLCAQVLRLTGADVSVVVRREHPRMLLSKWGIPAQGIEAYPERETDVVVDCTGSNEGFAAALKLLRPRGTLVLKSTYAGMPSVDLTQVVIDEINVVGSRCGPFTAALRLLEQRLVDVESMIEAIYPFEQALAAFEAAFQPGMLKVLLKFD
ncbi:alcohol dehydrogenase catalytic domain-containing protein [Aggregatilineales bacterium SYSU G02658]